MHGHLITVDGTAHEIEEEVVRRLISSSTRFWLDIEGEDPNDYVGLLRGAFGFHPLAVEDAEHFGQRPKIDTYEGFALMVIYGASAEGRLVEVHCFFTDDYLVTVHQHPCSGLTELIDKMQHWHGARADHVMLLYRVVDHLVDGYFPVLAQMDDQIDEIENEILACPTDEQLGRLFDMKRSLISLRKAVVPQRDMFATILSDRDLIPGMTRESERYFRDLYDHLIRISELVDNYRDLLAGALDTHLSTVSNRLNVVMKQLTLIATVFLPLTFLTGFFGQNFGWMVNRLTSLGVFLGLGIAIPLIISIGLYVMFRTRGWLTATGAPPSPEGEPTRRVARSRSDRHLLLLHPKPTPAAVSQPAAPSR